MADPWMKFYPQDFNGDEQLRLCSLATRGLWACFFYPMHKAEPYGHLLLNGRTPDHVELARLVGCTPREIKVGIDELIKNGVASLTDGGVLFSRRMVRDADKRKVRQENGRLGGNPLLKHFPEKVVNQGLSHQITPIASGTGSGISVSEEISEKAARFLERYPKIYAEERRGAHFRLKPVLHFMTACELVQGWPDEAWLELMFRTFCKLPASEKMAWPGTPAQFLFLAPSIDARLREAGV